MALSKKPGWTISGAWTADGQDLLVVDALYNQVLRYDRAGVFRGSLPHGVTDSIGGYLPSVIKPAGDQLVLEMANARLVSLAPDLTPIVQNDLLSRSARAGLAIKSIFLWDLAGDDLIGYGDLYRASDAQWSSAIFRFPLGAPDRFQVVRAEKDQPIARTMYRLGNPYFCGLGQTAYFLAFDDPPGNRMAIYRQQAGGKPVSLRAFPADLPRTAPALPAWRRPTEFAPMMKALEAQAGPAGLYAWEGYLYLLYRLPAGRQTHWRLAKIDGERDVVVGTADLPLQAHHVTAVPGVDRWAFVEKGAVQNLGVQDAQSLYFLAADELRGNLASALCR